MNTLSSTDIPAFEELRAFFNAQHEKLLCTVSKEGIPNIALMGTPRITRDGMIEVDISDRISATLDNLRSNRSVVFMTYRPGARARDFFGARITAQVIDIFTAGEKFDGIRKVILEHHGPQKAAELVATITCSITRIRPIVDRGQPWNKAMDEPIL